MPDSNIPILAGPPKPEPTQPPSHPKEQKRATWAIGIAVLAAFFTGWQGWEAHRQAEDADQARLEAKAASDAQAKDVERSRKAAEKSADAASKLADGMNRSASAAEASAQSGREALGLNRRALMLSERPQLQVTRVSLQADLSVGEVPTVQAVLFNSGKGVAFVVSGSQWIWLNPRRVFTYQPAAELIGRSVSDMAPGLNSGRTLISHYGRPLTEADLKAITSGTLQLYVYGRAPYEDDTFATRRNHTYYWCAYYDPVLSKSTRVLALCPEHNYTKP